MSALYPKGKKKILDADIDLLVHDIQVLLIDTADESYDPADEFHSDITAAAIVATSGNLSGKTTTDGIFDADDITISSVSGDSFEALILMRWTGTSGTSPLICWLDVFPYTPTGGNIVVSWDNLGIFQI